MIKLQSIYHFIHLQSDIAIRKSVMKQIPYQYQFQPDYIEINQKMGELTNRAGSQASGRPSEQLQQLFDNIKEEINQQQLQFIPEDIYSKYASPIQLKQGRKNIPECCPGCGDDLKKSEQCEFCAQVFCNSCCFRKRIIPGLSEGKDSKLECENCHSKFVKLLMNQKFYTQTALLLKVVEFAKTKFQKSAQKAQTNRKQIQQLKKMRIAIKIKENNLLKEIKTQQKNLASAQQQLETVVKSKAKKMRQKLEKQQIERKQKEEQLRQQQQMKKRQQYEKKLKEQIQEQERIKQQQLQMKKKKIQEEQEQAKKKIQQDKKKVQNQLKEQQLKLKKQRQQLQQQKRKRAMQLEEQTKRRIEQQKIKRQEQQKQKILEKEKQQNIRLQDIRKQEDKTKSKNEQQSLAIAQAKPSGDSVKASTTAKSDTEGITSVNQNQNSQKQQKQEKEDKSEKQKQIKPQSSYKQFNTETKDFSQLPTIDVTAMTVNQLLSIQVDPYHRESAQNKGNKRQSYIESLLTQNVNQNQPKQNQNQQQEKKQQQPTLEEIEEAKRNIFRNSALNSQAIRKVRESYQQQQENEQYTADPAGQKCSCNIM